VTYIPSAETFPNKCWSRELHPHTGVCAPQRWVCCGSLQQQNVSLLRHEREKTPLVQPVFIYFTTYSALPGERSELDMDINPPTLLPAIKKSSLPAAEHTTRNRTQRYCNKRAWSKRLALSLTLMDCSKILKLDKSNFKLT